MRTCPNCSMKITETTDQCPWCNRPVPAGAGYVTAYEQPAGASSFSSLDSRVEAASRGYREGPRTWIWLGNLATILVGVLLIALKLGGNGGVLGGVVLIALAVLSLAVSRFGRRWDGTTFWTKAMIVPGALAAIALFMLALAWLLDWDSRDSEAWGHSESTRETTRRRKKQPDTEEEAAAVNSPQSDS